MPEAVLNLNTNRLVRGLGDQAPLTGMQMQYSGGERLRVHVRKDGLPHEFADGFEMCFTAKSAGDFAGDARVFEATFELDGNAYVAVINLITEEIQEVLQIGEATELESVEIVGQFSWRESGEEAWTDLQVMALTVYNSIRRGDEGPISAAGIKLRIKNGALVAEGVDEATDEAVTGHTDLNEGEPEGPGA